MKSWAHLMKWYRWRRAFVAGAVAVGGCVAVCGMYATADTIPGLPRLRMNRHGVAERPIPAPVVRQQNQFAPPVSFLTLEDQAGSELTHQDSRQATPPVQMVPPSGRATQPSLTKGPMTTRLPRVEDRLRDEDFEIQVTSNQTAFPGTQPEVLADAPRIQFNRAPRMHRQVQHVEPVQQAAAGVAQSTFTGESFKFQVSPRLHAPVRLEPKPLTQPAYVQPRNAQPSPEQPPVQTADHFLQKPNPNTTAGGRQFPEAPVPTHVTVIPQPPRMARLDTNQPHPNATLLAEQELSFVPRETPRVVQELEAALPQAPVVPPNVRVPTQSQPANLAGQPVPAIPPQQVPLIPVVVKASPAGQPPVTPTQVAPAQVAPAQVAPAQVAPAQVAPAQVAPPQVRVQELPPEPNPQATPDATPPAEQKPETPLDPPAIDTPLVKELPVEPPQVPANPPTVETSPQGELPPVDPPEPQPTPPAIEPPAIEPPPVVLPEVSPQDPGADFVDTVDESDALDGMAETKPLEGVLQDDYTSSSGTRRLLPSWAPKPMLRTRELTLVEKVLHPGEPCFDRCISPMTNPFNFEDPRTLTEARVIFANHRTPSLGGTPSAHVQLFAVQLRAALTERLSLIATKDGFITSNSAFIDDGWADVNMGMKYNLYRDVERQRLVSGGLTFELPVGSTRAQQGNGSGEFHLFLTGMTEIIGGGHWISAAGLRIPTDQQDENEMWYWSNHFDMEIYHNTGFYAFTEFNWYQWTGSGTRFALPIEGGDLFNFGSPGIAGNSIVTGAFGMKYKPNRNLETGIAWELPLTNRRGVLDNRLTVDCIFRY